MARILALDYGTKRTGVAVSDPLRIIATALETIPTHTIIDFLKQYIYMNDVDTIVLGKPTQMNGQPSQTMPAIEALAAKLKTLFPAIEIKLHDERFTSVMAQRTILESGIGKMKRRDKSLVDKVSATIILQSYMTYN